MADRVTQQVAEVLTTGTASSRITQQVAEALTTGTTNSRITQMTLEVLTPNTVFPHTSVIMVEGTRQAFKP